MNINDYILDAVENLLNQDLPEDVLPDAIKSQAELLAGASLDSLD